ncbi:hypothetical protein V7O61_10825 [Methanolobus sp. WCC1]|uniref:hypothetical protein n=1 Tax=unclassified Methanolobus TaxID=2629569 RepID=UPI00324B83E8
MILKALFEEVDIKKAHDLFADAMKKDSISMTKTLGWQGGNVTTQILWNSKLKIWSHFDREVDKDDYWWCVFGVQNPNDIPSSLNITCEINFSKDSLSSKRAGLFAQDDDGNIYITHSGNVRGGKKGIGPSKFKVIISEEQYVKVMTKDGRESTRILVAKLNSSECSYQVASFVKQVYRFKINEGYDSSIKKTYAISSSYSPEFSGVRKSYKVSDVITSKCNHGLIVNALRDNIKEKGIESFNDNLKDLFIYNNKGQIIMLFEVKTDLLTTSIYTAIGQLKYHSALYDSLPKQVIVLPGVPNERTTEILNKIGIEVLQYKLKKSKVKFIDLDRLLDL